MGTNHAGILGVVLGFECLDVEGVSAPVRLGLARQSGRFRLALLSPAEEEAAPEPEPELENDLESERDVEVLQDLNAAIPDIDPPQTRSAGRQRPHCGRSRPAEVERPAHENGAVPSHG